MFGHREKYKLYYGTIIKLEGKKNMTTTFDKIMILVMSIVLIFVTGYIMYENSEERIEEKRIAMEQHNAEMAAEQERINSMYDWLYEDLAEYYSSEQFDSYWAQFCVESY